MVVENAYEIGFALAGASTGGAFHAGVMDFLLEAMAAWEDEKAEGTPNVAPWPVKVTEMIGTSAGGITSTFAVAALNIDHQPLPRGYKLGDPSPKNNPLFDAWVKEMTYEALFDTSDLDDQPEGKKIIHSLLNSNFMYNVATKVLHAETIKKELPSWAAHMFLGLTAFNLRGVPYALHDFNISRAAEDNFYMYKHGDYTLFRITTDPASVSKTERRFASVLDVSEQRNTKEWAHAIDCSRASAALPFVFPTVQLETPERHYEKRLSIAPDWPASQKPKKYKYAAVDGGVSNNRPFGTCRANMAMIDKEEEEEDANTVGQMVFGTMQPSLKHSMILIDPFPAPQQIQEITEGGMPLWATARATFAAVRAEASFKEDEIKAALDPQNMDKFLLKPERKVLPGQKYPLATTTLDSFGGMLDEKIRLHDFELGRKNCKYFLEEVLVISLEDAKDNPIFGQYQEYLAKQAGETVSVIPVVGGAAREISQPIWPTYSKEEREAIVKSVMAKVAERTKKVVRIYLENSQIIKTCPWWPPAPMQCMLNKAAELVSTALENELMRKVEVAIEDAMKVYVD